jgi:hypothetical protein
MTSTVSCSDCETLLIDESNQESERLPCLMCGSTRRNYCEYFQDVLPLHERIGLKVKRPGIKKPIHEQIVGADLTHLTGRVSEKVRIIDRLNDRYFERITDLEAGKILHQREEPLSHHYGRGTARFQEHGLEYGDIAVAAYYIWEKKGCSHGHDNAHWNMAIEDLKRAAAGVPTLN